MRTQQDGSTDQCAGLVDVHLFQFGQGELLAHAGEVDRLSARHAARTGGHGQQLHHLQLFGCIVVQTMFGQQLERQTLQRITHQQRGGFVVFNMTGRFATAQHIVVHAGHVVVYQRIGMDEFDRSGSDLDAFD